MHVLPTLVEDLLDVVGWSYNGVNDVVLHDVYETILDPGKSDHPLAAGGVVPQTPCDVAANLYLQTRLAEIDIAVAAQLKAHHVLHDPMKPLRIADQNVRHSEAICEVGENWQRTYWRPERFWSDRGSAHLIGDFAPVAFICSYSFFMFVPNSLPVKSVSEFIAYGKANKGKLTLASPGTGSSPHLCGELFKHKAGLDMIHVPYREAAPAMNDLIPGRVHLLFSGGATLDNARSGQVQVLGYTGAKRSAIASNVPTIAESGVPGFDVVSWYGFFVPARPRPRSSRK